MSSSTRKNFFEYEFQREAPISLFYVWYCGHIEAYRLLGLDSAYADKVFAINQRGIWSAYTQQNNLDIIKAAIREMNLQALEKLIQNYLDEYNAFIINKESVFNKQFIYQLVGKFVVVFTLGDITDHPLQQQALEARMQTEKLFYLISQVLTNNVNSEAQFPYLTYDEIIDHAAIADNALGIREKSILSSSGIIPIQNDGDLKAFLARENIQLYQRETESQLSGRVAMGGFATGRVKIVSKKSDFSKMISGDVLVSPMTTPEFLPIIKQAAAVITDEGGITSHAAITCRELGKPCIVGTINASRFLTDGDLVEVDATNGTVKVIEK